MNTEYQRIRSQTNRICLGLSEKELSFQSREEVSPAKWHLGHTTWFFEKMILEQYMTDYKVFNSEYNFVFNSYYKQIGKHLDQSERGTISISSIEIINYRKYVDKMMVRLMGTSVDQKINDLITVGLNHEEQHQELLYMDIKSNLHSLGRSETLRIDQSIETATQWLDIPEGIMQCGNEDKDFCYDNEQPRHKVFQYTACISKSLVTNAEYSEFMKSGGYSDPKYWLSKGWDWLQTNSISEPLYWNDKLNPMVAVAHISYFEADAYANWSGCRLPTEFEHEYYDQEMRKVNTLWGWTSSQYSAYPGFKKFDGELSEYNGKFMCNQFVLRGGCIATPKDHWRTTYRNFYEPHQRWMYSGIRLAKDGCYESN